MLGAVVVGVVSAAGMIIAEHYRQERRRHAMAQDLDRLNQQITGLQGQLEVLKKQQHSGQTSVDGRIKRRFRSRERTMSNITSTTADDYNSALDSSDMEFYDISDEETSKASTLTPLDDVLKDIDIKLEDPLQLRNALSQLENLLFDYPSSTEVLWRIGKAHQRIAMEVTDISYKMVHLNAGLDVCRQGIEINPKSGDVHKWYAILLGSRSSHQGIRDKLRDSSEFKHHIDLAIQLIPEDATCYYLLGRYVMEIASLKWYERKAVATLFDKLPECTYQQALENLLQADRMGDKDWKINKLSIAKCYFALGDYKEGLKWLDEANNITKAVLEEEGIEQEIAQLLSKYNGYR